MFKTRQAETDKSLGTKI